MLLNFKGLDKMQMSHENLRWLYLSQLSEMKGTD